MPKPIWRLGEQARLRVAAHGKVRTDLALAPVLLEVGPRGIDHVGALDGVAHHAEAVVGKPGLRRGIEEVPRHPELPVGGVQETDRRIAFLSAN